MTETDNVISRINKARAIIAKTSFEKSGTVKGGQSYSFIPIGQILAAVREAHAQAGVTVTFGCPEYDAEQFEKRYSYTKKGQFGDSTWTAANGHIHAVIYGSSVDDRIEMDVPFEAQDNSDKLTNKIITNAERCLYRVLYAIDEGDATDPEAFNYEIPAEKKAVEKKAAKKVPAKDDAFFGEKDTPAEIEGKRNYLKERLAEGDAYIENAVKRLGPIDEWRDLSIKTVYQKYIDGEDLP